MKPHTAPDDNEPGALLAQRAPEIHLHRQLQADLRTTQAQLATLLAALPDTVYTLDLASGATTFLNGAEFCGYEPGKFQAPGSILSAVHPDDKPPVLKYWQDLKNGSTALPLEYRLRDQAGAWHWVEQRTGVMTRGDDGAPRELLVTLRDITEHKHARGESAQMFFKLFEQSPFAIALSHMPDGMIVEVNRAFEQVFGFSKQQVIGKTSSELGISPDATTHARILAALQAHGAVRDLELTLHTKAGGARNFIVNLDMVEIGPEQFMLQTSRDITARNQMEEALRLSEQKYSVLFDRSTVPTLLFQMPKVTIVDLNEAMEKLVGYARAEMLGKTTPELGIIRDVNPEDVKAEFAQQGGLARDEMRIYTKQGEERIVQLVTYPLNFGERRFALTTMQDITARKRAEEELARRVHHLETLHEASVVFSQLHEPEAIGMRVLETVEVFTPYERAALALRDETSGEIHLLAHARMNLDPAGYEQELERVRGFFELPQGITRWVAEHGEPVRTGDVQSDPRYLEADPRIRSELCVPLQVGGRTIGALNVESAEPDAFDAEDEQLLTTLARGSAIAIDNARLVKELSTSALELRALAAHLDSAREQERAMVAREIHDEFGQFLSALKMDLAWIARRLPSDDEKRARLDEMMEMTDVANRVVHRIASALRPGLLDDLGLEAALQWQVKRFAERTGIPCEVIVPDKLPVPNSQVALALFRISQEALTNIARHARATRVEITLGATDDKWELRLEDNGRGFAPERKRGPENFGLIGMRERVRALGGELSIRSAPGEGTRILACVPRGREA